MDRSAILDFLNKIEQEYPVLEWKINNMKVWPLVRIRIFLVSLNFFENLNKGEKAPKPRAFQRIFKSVCEGFRLFINNRGPVPYLFLEASAHRVQYDGQNINRFFDFFMDEQERSGKRSVLVNYNDGGFALKKYQAHRTLSYEPLLDLMKLVNKFQRIWMRRKWYFHLPGFEKFYAEELHPLESKYALKFNVDRTGLSQWFELMDVEYRLDSIILRKLKPAFVFSLCYYSLPVMVFNQCAANTGIPTVELQHGPQTGHHAAYVRWNNAPGEGFNMMPKYFWCWDDESACEINSWAMKTDYHRAFNGGNPWVEYFKDKLEDSVPSQRPMILITLQPMADPLPKFVMEAIKKCQGAYDWWIRLHPRMLDQREGIKQTLRNQGIDDWVNVDQATLLPLPMLLHRAFLHVTRFSGATIEAALLGTKTVLIDPKAKAIFPKFITDGKAFVLLQHNMEALLDILAKESAAKENPTKEVADCSESHFPDYCKRVIAIIQELEKQNKKPTYA